MRSALELLADLRALGAEVAVVDGRVRLRAASGQLTDELRAELSERKHELLALLVGAGAAAEEDALLAAGSDAAPAPLSPAQERLWFLQRLSPASASYNVARAWRLTGDLDVAALTGALSDLTARHAVLRTVYPEEDGAPTAVVGAPEPVHLPVTDLGQGTEEQRVEAALGLAGTEALRPFDLARERPLRAQLARLDAGEHVLILVLHHIAADGWSLAVIQRELAELYGARRAGREAALPELPIQYGDYARWQHGRLTGGACARDLEVWRSRLAGLAPLEVATDRTRPPVQTFRGACERVVLPSAVSQGLAELARRTDATLFATALAAFGVLLRSFGGGDDVAVGSPVAGRDRTELEGLVGCFLNMLVLRADLSGDPTFLELSARIRAVVAEALEHRGLPFERLVEELAPERDASRNPLFSVFFAVQNAPEAPLALSELAVRPLAFERRSTDFDLDVHLWPEADGLRVDFVYNRDLFCPATVASLARAYAVLLEAIVDDPEARLSQLPLVGAADPQRLGAVGPTIDPLPVELLHELVGQQALRTPDAVAVRAPGAVLTYAELTERAQRIARELGRAGAGRGTLVALSVERGADLAAAPLGVLMAGAAYLPLDPAFPAERLAFLLEDAGAAVLLTERALSAVLPPFDGATVYLDELGAAADPGPGPQDPPSSVGPEDLAYVLYTSGSTGRPKGVEVPHRAVVSFLSSMQREPGLSASDVLLAVTTLSFDIAALELFLPLTVGAQVVIAARADAADGRRLGALLETSGTTAMQATPATWQLLIAAGWVGDGRLKILCGGEALPGTTARELLARGGELWNLYGPTETTIWSAVSRIEAVGDDESGPLPLGRPIANTRLLVLDEHGRPVPAGAPGELCIAGLGLARGYRDRPELTAERFVPSPWPEVPGRLYRTGDRVRVDGAGRLAFLGRTDDQVKLRGFRIELGEIEAALAQHAAVRQAALLVHSGPDGDARLVACVVPSAAAAGVPGSDSPGLDTSGSDSPGSDSPESDAPPQVDGAALRAHLRRTLPEYMVPGAFVALAELPLSPAGKVDRAALAERVARAPAARERPREIAAPSGPTEETVAGAFAQVLGVARVGAGDDFFDLGGHSLLATRLVSRLRALCEVELPLADVFEAPTVAELAERVERARRAGRPLPPPIHPVPRGADLPVSFAQRRLWFLDQMGAGAAYNMWLVLRFTGRLERAALARALERIVARHEILRTRFVAVDGAPRQVVEASAAVPLADVDRSDTAPGEGDRAVRELAVRAIEEPFDLARAPLLRAELVRLGADRHALILVFHHIAADGRSLELLAREIAAHYRAIVTGEAPDLPALPVQCADHAAWQRDRLAGPALDAALAAWRRALGGELPVLELATDRPRPPVQTFRGDSQRFRVDAAVTDGLRALARTHGATLAMTCLAAWQTLLGRYSGQEDVVVGSPIAGRTRSELEDLIGCFANSVVLRGDLSGDPGFAELLRRTRRSFLAAHDHQDLPFETLVDALDPERDPSRTPLFQVVFAMQDLPEVMVAAPGLVCELTPCDVTTARYDLELYLHEEPDGIVGRLVHNTDLFDAATAERMVLHLQTLFAGVVARPEAPVAELPLLTPAEQRQLAAWSAPATDELCETPGARGLHGEVEQRAAEHPDAVALVFGEREVTYADLDRRADQVAHALRSAGAEPGRLVGLCVERGPEMIVGWLGILKAGCAYLPLDPTYPRERLAFMLADSGLALLVTQDRLAALLPEHAARVLCLDRDAAAIEAQPATPPAGRTDPDDLAYAIYTSGSTGRPKAALLAHRGLLNVAREQQRAFGVGPGWRVLQFSSLSFDACTFEIVMALASGATLVLGERGDLMPGPDLAAFLRRQRIGIVTLPPTALAATPFVELPDLRVITVAGEECSADLVERWAPGRRFFNLYGPTEATIWSTTAELRAGDAPHIGRGIANTRIDVVDARGQPVPVGVPGELRIGGVGLARGYLGRPALTAERFVAQPAGPAGARQYRAGDRARWRPDGTLEFLGRVDHQVKLRGFRIEPGEIEATLDRDPAVRRSLALVREDAPGDRRLVAYVALDPAAEAAVGADAVGVWEDEHVSQWESLYESSYAEAAAPADGTFHIASWDSSYTGAPIPADEMRAWLERTVASVVDRGPRRVLEIGCGTGLLLFRIAPHTAEYRGTDLSQAALDHVQRTLATTDVGAAQVRLEQRRADDFDGLPDGHFDTVVLNSVVQYFPSAAYLERVLAGAARVLAPGGRIFIGDVRSRPLLEAFHASVQRHRSDSDLDVDRLRRRIRREVDQDGELVLDPAFFRRLTEHLPRVRRVALEPKPGRYDNELNRFRYDVLLTLDCEPAPAPAARRLEWTQAGLTLALVRELCADEAPECLVLAGVPNRRTQRAAAAVSLLAADERPATAGELERALDASPAQGVEPEDLRDLARELGFDCALSWLDGRPDGAFDVVFRRGDGVPDPAAAWDVLAQRPARTESARSRADCANRPLRGRLLRELVPRLRSRVAESLPPYMAPSAIVCLDAFPVTPNGKIDRRALPAPEGLRTELAETYEAPRTAVEEALAAAFEGVLGAEHVGRRDNFFELGGDSIQSIQVVAAARAAGVRVQVKDLFQHQTVAALARVARVESGSQAGHADAEQGPVTGPLPLSPVQRWFFGLELRDPHHFNQALVLEPTAPIVPEHLAQALALCAEQHDALRLAFERTAAGWCATILPPGAPVPLAVHDLSGVPAAERARAVERECSALQADFDLAGGLPVRAALFRSGNGEPDRLALVVHHLAVDAVSWRVLLEDLARALSDLGRGRQPALPPKTTSVAAWARALTEHAASAPVLRDARHWLGLSWGDVAPLPVDHELGPDTVGATASVRAALTDDETRALLTGTPGAGGARITDVLLFALARALGAWTGGERVLVDVEGHGRDDVLAGVDLTRTVGWFTAIHPVVLPAGRGATLGAVRAQLAAIPGNGLPWGLARYLAPDLALASALAALPEAQVAFNYLGRLDGTLGTGTAFRLDPERTGSPGPTRSPRNRRAHLVEIDARVQGGHFETTWTYSRNTHTEESIRRVAEQFVAELRATGASAAEGHTPFGDFEWSAEEMGDILAEIDRKS